MAIYRCRCTGLSELFRVNFTNERINKRAGDTGTQVINAGKIRGPDASTRTCNINLIQMSIYYVQLAMYKRKTQKKKRCKIIAVRQ